MVAKFGASVLVQALWNVHRHARRIEMGPKTQANAGWPEVQREAQSSAGALSALWGFHSLLQVRIERLKDYMVFRRCALGT